MRICAARFTTGLGLASILTFGCTPQTSVDLKNNTSSTVTGKAFFSSDQNVLEDLIDNTGAEEDFTIAPGADHPFSRNCNDLQAIKVEGDLQVLVGLGPSQSTKVFRDGTDFGCGDHITFTFTAPNPPLTLNIDFSNP